MAAGVTRARFLQRALLTATGALVLPLGTPSAAGAYDEAADHTFAAVLAAALLATPPGSDADSAGALANYSAWYAQLGPALAAHVSSNMDLLRTVVFEGATELASSDALARLRTALASGVEDRQYAVALGQECVTIALFPACERALPYPITQ